MTEHPDNCKNMCLYIRKTRKLLRDSIDVSTITGRMVKMSKASERKKEINPPMNSKLSRDGNGN